MFSDEFMRFLINYDSEENITKKQETVKEIKFKIPSGAKSAKVYIAVK